MDLIAMLEVVSTSLKMTVVKHTTKGGMAESEDATDLKSVGENRVGSSPTTPTK